METKDLINIIPLDESTNDIAQQIINENELSKVQDLTHLFNLNQAKKNVLRIMKMNSLLDKVSDKMIERVEKRSDEFSHNDLLNYMNVVQASIDRANKSLNLIDETPAIQLNQVNINVTEEDALSRESRDRVTEAIKAIMDRINKSEIEPPAPIIIDTVNDTEKTENTENTENTILSIEQDEQSFKLLQGEE